MRSLLVLLTLSGLSALAQSPAPPTRQLTFVDGELIEGTDQRPDAELVDATRAPKHRVLLKLREDFRREVLGSVSQL